MQEASTSNFQ